jgi:Cdc6-like AAA superfamily ATPase
LKATYRTEANVEVLKTLQDRREDAEILCWITPVDYISQHNDNFGRRQPGTGQWLLNSKEFQDWYGNANRTLFCPGIPGAGKTILTSIVIDDVLRQSQDDPNVGIAYIYCNFKVQEVQTPLIFLSSLLKQLSQSLSSLPMAVRSMYNAHETRRSTPTLGEIRNVLLQVIELYSKVFILVDGLDECQVSNGCRDEFLLEVTKLRKVGSVNVFATSRFIPEIIEKFSDDSTVVEIRASKGDIATYLDGHMSRLPSYVERNTELQREIKVRIGDVVDGMYG